MHIPVISNLYQLLHDLYYVKFNYADNNLCLFLENYVDKRVVRWLAFHCHLVLLYTIGFVVYAIAISIMNEVPAILCGIAMVILCIMHEMNKNKNPVVGGVK